MNNVSCILRNSKNKHSQILISLDDVIRYVSETVTTFVVVKRFIESISITFPKKVLDILIFQPNFITIQTTVQNYKFRFKTKNVFPRKKTKYFRTYADSTFFSHFDVDNHILNYAYEGYFYTPCTQVLKTS